MSCCIFVSFLQTELVAQPAAFTFFRFGCPFGVFVDLDCGVEIFRVVNLFYYAHICGWGKLGVKVFQLVQAAVIFFLRINVGIIIKNSDCKILRKLFQNVRRTGTTAGMEQKSWLYLTIFFCYS